MSQTFIKNSIFCLILPLFMCHNPIEDRAAAAKEETWTRLRSDLKSLHIGPESAHMYIRSFKLEEVLEVWIKDSSQKIYSLFRTYPYCTNSGLLGPKLKEGDKQIPEGVYRINRFNPNSKFHLSLGLNYPNQADLITADKNAPGSDIFIHGKCSSVGCIAIGDEAIKELYTIASISKESIRVDIFPYRFGTSPNIDSNLLDANEDFWNKLKLVYIDFETSKEINPISISETGEYIVH